jgi:hypothetical protein
MADLSAGQHANVALLANEVLHVECEGSTAVLMLYGGPDGTTNISSGSQDFGPYGVPAKLRVTVTTGSATYNFHTDVPAVAPLDESVTIVESGLTATSLAQLVEDAGEGPDPDAPWGRGRDVRLAPGIFEAPEIDMSTSQSVSAAAPGSTVLLFAKHQNVTAETGVLNILDDRLSKRGIPSRGVIRNVVIDGANDDPLVARDGGGNPVYQVHGYFADQPDEEGPSGGDGEAHSFVETLFTKCTGDGIKIVGRHQFRGRACKAVDVEGFGGNFDGVHDLKSFGAGWNGKKGAKRIRKNATPKWYAEDNWIPAGFNGQATLDIADQTRMLQHGSECEGRIVIIGRSDSTSNKWEAANNHFRCVNIKIVEGLSPSFVVTRDDASTTGTLNCYVYIEDSDNNTFDGCTFKYGANTPTAGELTATPDYFMQLGTSKTGGANLLMYPGHVKFINMSGIVHRRARLTDGAPLLSFKKHYCDRPELIEWDIPVGQVVEIPWNDAAPPRNWVKAAAYGATTGTVYNKADYPMGYLWNTPGGTLDDVNTTFTVPPAPRPAASGKAFATPVWP